MRKRSGLHVECVQAGLSHQCQRVVFLKKQLPAGVEGNAVIRELFLQFLRLRNDQVHGLVPRCSLQMAILSDHGVREAVFALERLPPGSGFSDFNLGR